MKITICAFALAAMLSGSFPAYAEDAATIKDRLQAASAAVHSVVIDMEMSPPGVGTATVPRTLNLRVTVASPTRVRAIAVAGPIHVESYQVDGMLYTHLEPGDSWRKMSFDPTHPPAQILDVIRAAKKERVTVLPDITDEDGVTVGQIQLEMQLPAPAGTASVGPPVALTCSYDKITYRLRSCANAMMSMTLTKYDDPSNTFELPLGAASAVLVVTKTPAPAVSSPLPDRTTAPDPAPSTTP